MLKKKKILYLFLSAAVFTSGQVRTGRRTSGFPSHDLGSVPTKVRSRRLLDAGVWSRLNPTSLPGLNTTRTSEKPSGEGVPGLTLSSRPLLSVGMLLASPGSSLHLHHGLGSAPACPLGKGVNCLCPPLPTNPSPAWSHPAWVFRARPWMLFCADAKLLLLLLLQDALIHPHGGLTPRLDFFS